METASEPANAEQAGGSRWSRLRQRKVGQWGLAYLAGAFALLQGVELVATHFGWPPAVMRLAMIASAAGLPIALVLAWFHGERGEQHVTGIELAILIVLLLVGGLALRWAADSPGDVPAPAAAPVPERPVVAVLPLENLGADAAFAAGLHDELIARLSLMQGIDVVSRTSTLAHRDSGLDARQIGKALGASHLLEGTVQRDGQRVRLHLQFIDARDDRHLFARTLQRDVTDVFQIQALIGSEIAESLRVALSAGERASLERRPTAVAEAYEAYLAARAALRRDELPAAAAQLESAVAADPGFIDAHALLTNAACLIAIHPQRWASTGRDWVAVAREHAAALERLAPQHPMTAMALGMVAYWIDVDIKRGRALLEQALAAMPNESSAVDALHWIHVRLGHAGEADRLLKRLGQLEPGTEMLLSNQFFLALRERDYARAIAIQDTRIALAEDPIDLRGERAVTEFRASGDVTPLRRIVAELADGPKRAEWQLALARFNDDLATASAIFAAYPEVAKLSRFQGSRGPRDMYLAFASPAAERGPLLAKAETVLDELAQDASDDPLPAMYRGWIAALGGDTVAALAHFARAEALLTREIDVLYRAEIAGELAIGYALAGAADQAQHWLAVCLQAHGGCHAMHVRHDVLWRPVRADPRTAILLAERR